LETKDDVVLMDRLGKVMTLPRQIVSALQEEHPDAIDTWHHWADAINGAFMVQNLHASWGTFRNSIDPSSLAMLRLSASLLRARTNTASLETERLAKFREELSLILNEILESGVSVEVKRHLARRLREIITMLEEYKLTGASRLLDEIETTIAHGAFDPEYQSFLMNTEIGKRLLDHLAAMASVVTVAVGLPQLTQAIQQLIR